MLSRTVSHPAVRTAGFQKVTDFCIIRNNHPSLDCGHMMAEVEAETAHLSQIAYFFSAVNCSKTFTAIFDQKKVIFFADSFYLFDFRRLTEEMNKKDGFSLGTDHPV